MTSPELSEGLVERARQAGYALTPENHSAAALLWSDPGGEIRFFVRQEADGRAVLTKAERAGDEQFELAGLSVEVIERYLYGVFG